MQRTSHRCPCCSQPLGMSWDMWGQYYLCHGCGFTAEDDDQLTAKAPGEPQPPSFLINADPSRRLWQTIQSH